MTTDAPRTRIPLGFIVLLGSLAALGPFTIDMYLPAFPALQESFHTTEGLVQSTLSAYFIGLAVGQMVLGPVADRFGRRPPLLVGLVVYILASLACALAPSVEALIVARFFQAVGACAGMVASRAVLRDLYPPRDMARALSLIMLVMGIAPIVAPMAGTFLQETLGWQAIFITLVAYGSLVLLATGFRLPETLGDNRSSLDLGNIVRRYLSLFAEPDFRAYALAGSFAQGGLFVYIASSSFVFTTVYDLTPTQFAVLFGVNAAGLIAASQLNERWLRRSTPQGIVRIVLAVFLVCSGLQVAAVLTGFGGVVGLAIPLWVTIACLGFCFPNTTAAAMADVGDRAGVAAAMLGTVQFGLAGVASYVAGQLFDGTAAPMTLIIFACGLLAWVALLSRHIRPTQPAKTMPVT